MLVLACLFFPYLTLVLTMSVCLSLFNAVSIFIIAKSLDIIEVSVTIFPSQEWSVCVCPVVFFFNLKFKTVSHTEIFNSSYLPSDNVKV